MAQRFGIQSDLAEALVCRRPRDLRRIRVLFAGPADDPHGIVGDAAVYRESRRALADRTLSFADFLRRENLVLRADLLRPWANWVTRRPSVPAATTPTSSSPHCLRVSAPTGRTPNPIAPGGPRPRPLSRTSRPGGVSCCHRPGPSSTRWPVTPSPKSWRLSDGSSPCKLTWR
ncbi:hypothetical protein I552_4692 [Mycobacterium xenopi 3993]|nr:hypothetical protein I552_4692 [Mycobacterium xenopi 3993]